MQHSARSLHHAEDRNREEEPEVEGADNHDGADDWRGLGEGAAEGHGPQNDGELLMSEGEGPETKVGCGVGDAVEAKFWMERLVDGRGSLNRVVGL